MKKAIQDARTMNRNLETAEQLEASVAEVEQLSARVAELENAFREACNERVAARAEVERLRGLLATTSLTDMKLRTMLLNAYGLVSDVLATAHVSPAERNALEAQLKVLRTEGER